MIAATTRASGLYHEVAYRAGDAILFSPETRGLPQDLLCSMDPAHLLRLPMRGRVDSLNAATAGAIALYAAWQARDFEGVFTS